MTEVKNKMVLRRSCIINASIRVTVEKMQGRLIFSEDSYAYKLQDVSISQN